MLTRAHHIDFDVFVYMLTRSHHTNVLRICNNVVSSMYCVSNPNSINFDDIFYQSRRNYFGPVNIQRMTVKLVSDRGNLVDLNNANWSFSLICEQLNKLEPNKK